MNTWFQWAGDYAAITIRPATAKVLCAVFCAAQIFAAARLTYCEVVNTTGNVILIAPPASVVLSSFEDNTSVQLFVEKSGFRLPASVTVDVTAAGVVDATSDLTPGQVAAHSLVDSYLLHADPFGPGNPVVTYQGTVTFNTPILGAMVTAASLSSSDHMLGSATTNYIPPTIFRGFEGPGFPVTAAVVSDTLDLSADFRTLSFLFHTTSQYDQIRVITAAVPEPSGVLAAERRSDVEPGVNAAVPEPPGMLAAVMAATFFGIRRRRSNDDWPQSVANRRSCELGSTYGRILRSFSV